MRVLSGSFSSNFHVCNWRLAQLGVNRRALPWSTSSARTTLVVNYENWDVLLYCKNCYRIVYPSTVLWIVWSKVEYCSASCLSRWLGRARIASLLLTYDGFFSSSLKLRKVQAAQWVKLMPPSVHLLNHYNFFLFSWWFYKIIHTEARSAKALGKCV